MTGEDTMLTDTQMKALVWLGPADLQLRDVPLPALASGEVLIETSAVGICGSELSGYLGKNSLRRPPLIMGHEAAGRILKIGGDETTLADGTTGQMGMRVTFNPLIVCGTCDRCRVGLTNLCHQRQLIGAYRPGATAWRTLFVCWLIGIALLLCMMCLIPQLLNAR